MPKYQQISAVQPLFGRPNITGTKSGLIYYNQQLTGACTISEDDAPIDGSARVLRYVDFAASGSNSLYGSALTVQPMAMRSLACIKY